MDTMDLLTKFANPETLKTLTTAEQLKAGFVTTFLGMGITFLALGILQFIIVLMGKLCGRENAVPLETAQPAEAEPSAGERRVQDEQLIAAITVALAMQLKTTAGNIVIRNIRKVEDPSPAWNRIGIAEQMSNNS